MSAHKFHVGQTVFIDASRLRNIPGGAHIVIKQLPERDGEFEYCLRSVNEPYDRVVRESQLTKAP